MSAIGTKELVVVQPDPSSVSGSKQAISRGKQRFFPDL
jgi:hypothetical protein